MNNKLRLLVIIFLLMTSYSYSQKIDSIYAKGNCEHCKERIEGVVSKLSGVKKVEWKTEVNKVICEYDPALIDNDQIQKAIATAGHDTKKYRAVNKVYKNLPACCKYDRDPLSSNSAIQSFEFAIEGMTCAEGCAKGIEMNIYKQKGVKFCEVNYDTKKAKVVFDSNKVNNSQIINWVESFKPSKEEAPHYKVIY
ncbi:MAG: heavy-metal-associated domain-containing protein [bacterium]|jgi:copper ion binding protein